MTASPNQFFHGAEVVDVVQPIDALTINDQAAIGLIGTAPGADLSVFPYHTPVLLNSAPLKAQSLGNTGTLPQAIADIYLQTGAHVVVVNVPSHSDLGAQFTEIIGSAAAQNGVHAFLHAGALVGVRPKTLVAPGFTSQLVANPSAPSTLLANPVVSALIGIAEALRGRVYASTPSTSDTDALAYAEMYSSDRLEMFYPQLMQWDSQGSNSYIPVPMEASMAGLTAWVHYNLGYWQSPSNKVVQCGGPSAPVQWDNTYTSEANDLNAAFITTLINMGAELGAGLPTGWRRWGNRAADGTFESVRTTRDAIDEALIAYSLKWLDVTPSPQILNDMCYSITLFFRQLQSDGAILGGRIWMAPEDNVYTDMANGVYRFRIDPTPAAPMEHVTYLAQLNDNYYANLVDTFGALIASNSSSSAFGG